MPLDISARFTFRLDQPTDVLLQFEAARLPEQAVLSAETILSPSLNMARVPCCCSEPPATLPSGCCCRACCALDADGCCASDLRSSAPRAAA
jgi:hypothetical protein